MRPLRANDIGASVKQRIKAGYICAVRSGLESPGAIATQGGSIYTPSDTPMPTLLIESRSSLESSAAGGIHWTKSWLSWLKPPSPACPFPSLLASMVLVPACSSAGVCPYRLDMRAQPIAACCQMKNCVDRGVCELRPQLFRRSIPTSYPMIFGCHTD